MARMSSRRRRTARSHAASAAHAGDAAAAGPPPPSPARRRCPAGGAQPVRRRNEGRVAGAPASSPIGRLRLSVGAHTRRRSGKRPRSSSSCEPPSGGVVPPRHELVLSAPATRMGAWPPEVTVYTAECGTAPPSPPPSGARRRPPPPLSCRAAVALHEQIGRWCRTGSPVGRPRAWRLNLFNLSLSMYLSEATLVSDLFPHSFIQTLTSYS